MVLQYFYPGCIEAEGRSGFPAVFDGVLHHAANRRLALVMGALPFLVHRTELVPVGTLRSRPILAVGRRSVGKGNDPVLQQITLRIGLDIDRHVLVMRRLASLG